LDEEGGATSAAGSSRGSPAPSPRGSSTPTQETTPPKSALTATPTKIPGRGSAIPKPGSSGSRLGMATGRGPTGSRQPSYTNLKGAKKGDGSGTPGQSGAAGASMVKEKSFVEKGFVETMKQPTVEMRPASENTPVKRTSIAATPQPFVGSPAMQERLEEKVANLQVQQELQQSKDTVKDLEEKLETIKIKRARELEKLKEFEKMKFQHEQLLEFKSRIMEAQALLQKELQKAKHDAREALEAKERIAEETAELSETVEMATLDKEMAEEKAETLQIELEATKEKMEELQVCIYRSS
jgi:dynactin 1